MSMQSRRRHAVDESTELTVHAVNNARLLQTTPPGLTEAFLNFRMVLEFQNGAGGIQGAFNIGLPFW